MADEPDDRAFLAALPDPAKVPKPRPAAPAKPVPAPRPPPSQVDAGAAFIGNELAVLRAAVERLEARFDPKALEARLVQAAMQGGREVARSVVQAHEPAVHTAWTSVEEGKALRKALEAQGRLLWRLAVWGALPALLAALAGLLRAMAEAGTLGPRWAVIAALVAGVLLAGLAWLGTRELIDALERRAAVRRWKAQRR